jgi:hypothetical protein
LKISGRSLEFFSGLPLKIQETERIVRWTQSPGNNKIKRGYPLIDAGYGKRKTTDAD